MGIVQDLGVLNAIMEVGARSRRRTQSFDCSHKQELEFCTSERWRRERMREGEKEREIFGDASR